MKNKIRYLCASVLSTAVCSTYAQIGGGGVPLLQIPPAPVQESAPPSFKYDKPVEPQAPVVDNTRIRVNQLKLTGALLYPQEDLLALTNFQPGNELSLTDLRLMTRKIADYYHSKGYFVAQASLPAQDIKDGVVTIAIVVGNYGQVKINNQTNLSDGLANNLMSGVESGDQIESDPLETRLLLLSDLAGVKVNSTLVPGAQAGTSDLLVNLTPGPRVTGSIDADNAGLPYTGSYRLGGTVNVNNLAGLGDVASENGSSIIENWLRNKNTLEFLSVWEEIYNPGFNSLEFEGIKKEAGLNRFTMSVKQWIEKTNATGMFAKAGRYGVNDIFKPMEDKKFLQALVERLR